MRDLFPSKPCNPRDILYKGRCPDELLREELVECALFLKEAHLKLIKRIDEMNRRIDKLEEGYDDNELMWLNRWLAQHPMGQVYSVDDRPRPPDWRSDEWREEYTRKTALK
jgi:hypothetical protein